MAIPIIFDIIGQDTGGTCVSWRNPSTSVSEDTRYTNIVENKRQNNTNYCILDVAIYVTYGGAEHRLDDAITRGHLDNGHVKWDIDFYAHGYTQIRVEINTWTKPQLVHNLTGCQASYQSTDVEMYQIFKDTLVANVGYDLHDATVSITFDGVSQSGWINPPEKTRRVEMTIGEVIGVFVGVPVSTVTITATAVRYTLSVTYNLTNCIMSPNPATIDLWDNFGAVIVANQGYSMVGGEVSVLYGGVSHPEFNIDNNYIQISNVTEDIVITASAFRQPYFYFYPSDGSSASLRVQALTLKTFKAVQINSAQRKVTINGNDYTYSGATIPEGKILAGYSDSPNSSIVKYPLGVELYLNIGQDHSFYEVIIDEPTGSKVMMNLYQNNAEVNRVNKDDYLELVGTIYGTFKDITSITNPSILIESDYIQFNYVYISELHRWYFVEEVIMVKNRLWQVRLKVDVLMTYKYEIGQQQAYIARNEFDYNPDIIDSEIVVENEPDIEVIEEDDTMFDEPMDISDTVITYKED